jgi:hypothetical protein
MLGTPRRSPRLTFSEWQATISGMTTVTQPAQAPTITLHTQLAYLADDQVTRPVGVRTVEPPPDTRQALRGNLYAVVELPGESAEQEALAERLLSTIQRTYYTVKGTQSHVLREALREAKRVLDAQNADAQNGASGGNPVRAAIVIATILGRRLLIVSNGLGLALATAGEKVDVYPPYNPSAPAEEAIEPEGGWEIYRQELPAGGAIFIGGRRWLESLTLRELASTVAYLTNENYAEAVAALLEQAGQPALPGALIIVSPPSGIVKAPLPPPAGLPPALRRPRYRGLPTSVNATPPVFAAPIDQEPAIAPHSTPAAEPAVSTVAAAPGAATTVSSAMDAGKTYLQAGYARVRSAFGTLFPDRGGASAPNPVRSREVSPMVSEPMAAAVASNGNATPLLLPPRAQGSRARLLILVAVLILVLVPILVAARQWSQGAGVRADAEALLDLAEARLASAQESFDAGDKVGARTLLAEAQGHVDRARTILVGRYPRADEIAVEIQRETMAVLQIQPLYGLVQPLLRFPTDAQPQRVLVVDQDIYVLDSGRQVVQHYRLDLTTNTVPDQNGDAVLRQGQRVGDAEVGRLVAMAWQLPIPGIEDKPHLLILDRNNQLFKYDSRVVGVARVQIAETPAWVAPSHIYAYANRVYVLDQGANQIFRYDPINYGQTPESWFAAQTPVNLNGVQSLAIDGDIWLLYTDGLLLRYSQGLQVNFALESSIPLLGEPVDLAVGNQSDSLVYLADRSEQRILVFDKQGVFQRQLQAAEGDPLAGLSGLFVDETSDVMYILTRSALYQHALPK